MSQFDVINRSILHQANVLNNEYKLLMFIDNMQNEQGKEWYEALPLMDTNQFLAHLATKVHLHRFRYKGAEKMLKRLETAGYLAVEELKVQVTEKWRDIVDEYGGYLQNGAKVEDQKVLANLDILFDDIDRPKTQNFKTYRAIVNKFVYEGNKAFKRKIVSEALKARLDKFKDLLKSDYQLKQFFEGRLRANAEADNPPNGPPDKAKGRNTEGGKYSNAEMQKNIDERLNWRINLTMTEAMFFQELENTKFWIELKGKRKMPLTEAEQTRLEWVLDALSNVEGSRGVYQKRVKTLKAEQAATTGAPIAADVAKLMAQINIKKV